jgi:hypothetical protein
MCVKVRISIGYSGLVAKCVTLYFDVPECVEINRNPIKVDSIKG